MKIYNTYFLKLFLSPMMPCVNYGRDVQRVTEQEPAKVKHVGTSDEIM